MSVRTAIETAFDGVPCPDHRSRTLRQAEAWDSYRQVDQSRDHRGRWQDLPAAHIRECEHAVPHLDAQGVRYYLPALMCHYLAHPDERKRWGFTSLVCALGPPGPGLASARRQQLSLLTDDQRRAVALFVAAMEVEEEILVMWRRWLPG